MFVYRRVRFRLIWSVLLALGLAVAASAQPSLTLQVVQCSMVGVVFTLLAAVLQRIVDRPRRGATAIFGEPQPDRGLVESWLLREPDGGVGSDDLDGDPGPPDLDHGSSDRGFTADVRPGLGPWRFAEPWTTDRAASLGEEWTVTFDSRQVVPQDLQGWAKGAWVRLLVATSLVVLLLGASPPDAVRIRVPAEKVGTWFPPVLSSAGSPRSSLRRSWRRPAQGQRHEGRAPARLLQARHFARWNAGLLTGRSELVVDAPAGPGPHELILGPWTPAIAASADLSAILRMHSDGRTAIRVAAGRVTTVTLNWQVRA